MSSTAEEDRLLSSISSGPSLQDVEVVRDLVGYSGCKVLLCRLADTYFVRKISASGSYNSRFREQIDKQIRLSALIHTPRVLAAGEQDGLLFFDMEYVNGQDFRTRAPLSNIAGVCELVHRILEPIEKLCGLRTGSIPPERFHSKVTSVSQGIRKSPYYALHTAFLEAAMLRMRSADWSDIPMTECHGDLTLENILVKEDGSIVFIDLLDGDLDSVWLDVAKLLQDLHSGWSLRALLWKSDLSSADRLMSMLSRYLYEEIDTQVRVTFPSLGPKLVQLRTLQALRVLPYVRDEGTFAQVVKGLEGLDR